VLQVEVFQLHLSRLGPMATSTTPQPYTADRPENSTTSVDANFFRSGEDGNRSMGLPGYANKQGVFLKH